MITWLAASPRRRSEDKGCFTAGRWGALSGSPHTFLRIAINQNGWPGQGHAQGPGLVPQRSASSAISPENPGSAPEEADNLPGGPRCSGWRTWSKGHPGALGKTYSMKVMGTTGFRESLESKYLGGHTQEIPCRPFLSDKQSLPRSKPRSKPR